MEPCREDLTVSMDDITTHPVYVLEEQRCIVGFYQLRDQGNEVILTDLFVESQSIGKGYERQLWQHAVTTATQLGFEYLVLQSDPMLKLSTR